MPDPRLQQAMSQIAKVLRTYDIAASITLASRTHAQWYQHFPTWSVVQPERGPQGEVGYRIRSLLAYYRDKAHQHDDFEATMHTLLQIRDISAKTALGMDAVREIVEAQGITIEHHGGSGFEPVEEP